MSHGLFRSKILSAIATSRLMTTKEDIRRAQWKRNKRVERERNKRSPHPLDPKFERKVWDERDERAAAAYRGAWCWPESRYLSGERLIRAVGLAADVWAADVLFAAQWDGEKPSATLVSETLKRSGRTHGYTDGSLRKLIAKARERVRLLETTGEPWKPNEVFWPPFQASEDG